MFLTQICAKFRKYKSRIMNNNCRYTHTNANFSPVPIFQGLHMHIISIKCENKCPQ